MSWDVRLGLHFAEYKDPVTRFLQIADRFELSDRYDMIMQFGLHKYLKQESTIELFCGYENETPITLAQIQQALRSFAGDDLRVDGTWFVPSRFQSNEPDEPTGYRVKIDIQGAAYTISAPRYRNYDMNYNVGDNKYFSLSICDEAARHNCKQLIEEATLLVTLGVRSLQGLDATAGKTSDNGVNPLGFFITYRLDPDDYRQVIQTCLDSRKLLPKVTSEDVMEAAFTCEDIDFVETDNELIIFHKDFIDGDLYGFYQRLLEIVESRI